MPRKKSTVAFIAALTVFVGAFALIVLLMSTGTHADLIGFVLYVSGTRCPSFRVPWSRSGSCCGLAGIDRRAARPVAHPLAAAALRD